jgi:hypothetical protein
VCCICVLSYTHHWQVLQITILALLPSNHKTFFFIKMHAAETYPCIKDLDLILLQY